MKKKFVKVMLFGALALSALPCLIPFSYILLRSYLLLYIWVEKDCHLAYSTVDSFDRHLLQLVLFSIGRID